MTSSPRSLKVDGMASFSRISKQLICAHCDAVLATAAYRPLLSWQLDIKSPDGHPLAPLSGSILLRIAQQRLASAPPAEQPQAKRRVDFIDAHLAEVIYDLPCPRGHHTLITAPQIARAMRKTSGGWVSLTDGSR